MKAKRVWTGWMVVIFVLSLVFAVSCAKEGLRDTPDKPGSPGDEMAKEGAGAEGQTDAEMAKLREQLAKEIAEMSAKELRKQVETEKVFFAFDSAKLTQASKVALLRKAGYMMEKAPEIKLLIEGHCDERGSVEYNLALGQRRAESAKDYLVKAGVDSDRIRTVSYGKERPVDPAHNEDAWSQNRRDEFIIE
ncbi:MAG: peptidoglycan-associated lipoprotein Pal [Deltaproteobacteria bacterium]|nr:peptidoglycan-associated lipoprotein Pal [Deltaproteobacteria bacterium]